MKWNQKQYLTLNEALTSLKSNWNISDETLEYNQDYRDNNLNDFDINLEYVGKKYKQQVMILLKQKEKMVIKTIIHFLILTSQYMISIIKNHVI